MDLLPSLVKNGSAACHFVFIGWQLQIVHWTIWTPQGWIGRSQVKRSIEDCFPILISHLSQFPKLWKPFSYCAQKAKARYSGKHNEFRNNGKDGKPSFFQFWGIEVSTVFLRMRWLGWGIGKILKKDGVSAREIPKHVTIKLCLRNINLIRQNLNLEWERWSLVWLFS